MNRTVVALILLPLLIGADWPQWRGPTRDGVSAEVGVPTEWDGTTNTNVKWKTRLPGAGNSCPVIRGEDVIVTASSGREHSELHVLCYDRKTGRERWKTDLVGTPADAPFRMFAPERGHAASTPVITDKAVLSLFGTGDLVCLDRRGQPLWMRSLTQEYGLIRNDYGIASSPLLEDGMALVQIDHLEGSYLLAVDVVTGKTRWKADRKGVYDNWSSPVVATIKGVKQVVCLGTKTLTTYELATGKKLATVDVLERLCSPTPIVRGSLLYAASGPGGANVAVDLAVETTPKILWQSKKNAPFVPSAILANGLYFVADDQGMASCLDLATGGELWRERLAFGRMRPSPVAADGCIYFTALDGTTIVVKASEKFQIVSKNPLGEEVAASLAVAEGCILIRAEKHLYCIQDAKKP